MTAGATPASGAGAGTATHPTDARTAFLLALADDELVMGHREAFWIGVAPSLEEDIAFAGISQDEINHADVWYQLLAGDDRAAVDALALGRPPDAYRHAVLVERRPAGFADMLARHFLYDHADTVRLRALEGSTDPEVAAVARTLVHEERYHIQHADTWFWRIARSSDDAAERLHTALTHLFADAQWLFEPVPGEPELVDGGVLPVPSARLHERWLEVVGTRMDEAGFDLPPDTAVTFAAPGGRHGVHTSDWTEDAWQEMTRLHREHAGATW